MRLGEKCLHFWQHPNSQWPTTLVWPRPVRDRWSLQSPTSGRRGSWLHWQAFVSCHALGLSHHIKPQCHTRLGVGARITFPPVGRELLTKGVGPGRSSDGKATMGSQLYWVWEAPSAEGRSHSAYRMDGFWCYLFQTQTSSQATQHTPGCPLPVGGVCSGNATKFDYQSN